MGGLRALGVGVGDRVATLGFNHFRHLEAYFAVPGMGAVGCGLPIRMPCTATTRQTTGVSVAVVIGLLGPTLRRIVGVLIRFM